MEGEERESKKTRTYFCRSLLITSSRGLLPLLIGASLSSSLFLSYGCLWHTMYFSLTLFLLFCPFFSLSKQHESAWNGHVSPGADSPSPFSPFYVAPGTTPYSSDSPAISYAGIWNSFSADNASVHYTTAKNASALFHFTGTGVEWYGGVGKRHGSASVYLEIGRAHV